MDVLHSSCPLSSTTAPFCVCIVSGQETSKMVLLMDLVTPSGVESTDKRNLFFTIYAQSQCSNCTVVIAQSPSFELFYTLKPIESSAWAECMYRAKFIDLKPFTDDMAKTFLSSLLGRDVVEGAMNSMVQYCKGIPKLLSMCSHGVAHLQNLNKSCALT